MFLQGKIQIEATGVSVLEQIRQAASPAVPPTCLVLSCRREILPPLGGFVMTIRPFLERQVT
jgi:hypothetical protein